MQEVDIGREKLTFIELSLGKLQRQRPPFFSTVTKKATTFEKILSDRFGASDLIVSVSVTSRERSSCTIRIIP